MVQWRQLQQAPNPHFVLILLQQLQPDGSVTSFCLLSHRGTKRTWPTAMASLIVSVLADAACYIHSYESTILWRSDCRSLSNKYTTNTSAVSLVCCCTNVRKRGDTMRLPNILSPHTLYTTADLLPKSLRSFGSAASLTCALQVDVGNEVRAAKIATAWISNEGTSHRHDNRYKARRGICIHHAL